MIPICEGKAVTSRTVGMSKGRKKYDRIKNYNLSAAAAAAAAGPTAFIEWDRG